MFDVKNFSCMYDVSFGVVWDRRINVSFAPLCLTKWRFPLQSELIECLVNGGHWFLCMCIDLIRDMSWGLGEPQSCWRNMPIKNSIWYGVCSVQFSHSVTSDSATTWTLACQGSLFFTNSWSLLNLMSITLVMPSNHLILCRPFLLLPSVFPRNRFFSNESLLYIS